MDHFFQLRGLLFVWDDQKASSNWVKHGIRFETAAEIFLDALLTYEDAGVEDEDRMAAIGRSFDRSILYAVHIEREDGQIRIISARDVTAGESSRYENRRGER